MMGKVGGKRMRSGVVKVALVAVVAVLPLGGPGIGHAMTVDSINLNVTAGQYSASSTSLGVFNQNLSDGGQVQVGPPPEPLTTWSVQASQNTDIENSNGVLSVVSNAGVNGSLTGPAGPNALAASSFSVQFTSVTGGTYTINGGVTWGPLSFYDVTSDISLVEGLGGQSANSTGTLVAGDTYVLTMQTEGSLSGGGTSGFVGGWGMDFTAADEGSPVPIPPSLFLFASGMVGALTARRRLKK